MMDCSIMRLVVVKCALQDDAFRQWVTEQTQQEMKRLSQQGATPIVQDVASWEFHLSSHSIKESRAFRIRKLNKNAPQIKSSVNASDMKPEETALGFAHWSVRNTIFVNSPMSFDDQLKQVLISEPVHFPSTVLHTQAGPSRLLVSDWKYVHLIVLTKRNIPLLIPLVYPFSCQLDGISILNDLRRFEFINQNGQRTIHDIRQFVTL